MRPICDSSECIQHSPEHCNIFGEIFFFSGTVLWLSISTEMEYLQNSKSLRQHSFLCCLFLPKDEEERRNCHISTALCCCTVSCLPLLPRALCRTQLCTYVYCTMKYSSCLVLYVYGCPASWAWPSYPDVVISGVTSLGSSLPPKSLVWTLPNSQAGDNKPTPTL